MPTFTSSMFVAATTQDLPPQLKRHGGQREPTLPRKHDNTATSTKHHDSRLVTSVRPPLEPSPTPANTRNILDWMPHQERF